MYDLFATSESVQTSFEIAEDYQIPLIIGEFACSHPPAPTVACETIMENALKRDLQYSYMAWSYSGNSGPLQQLDLVDSNDWKTLTPYGRLVVHESDFGIARTAQPACVFPRQICPNETEYPPTKQNEPDIQ